MSKPKFFLQLRNTKSSATSSRNGILSQSPGLRGTSYPGKTSNKYPNRNAVAAISRPSIKRNIRHNRVAVVPIMPAYPR